MLDRLKLKVEPWATPGVYPLTLFDARHGSSGESYPPDAINNAFIAVSTPCSVGGIAELRDGPNAQRDQPASNSPLPLPASVAVGVLMVGAGGLYVVRMRRG
jgi:hypothetical protein